MQRAAKKVVVVGGSSGIGLATAALANGKAPTSLSPPATEDIARKNHLTETKMASEANGAFIRNIAEVPWREFPNHFGGALSKPLVLPETAGSHRA